MWPQIRSNTHTKLERSCLPLNLDQFGLKLNVAFCYPSHHNCNLSHAEVSLSSSMSLLAQRRTLRCEMMLSADGVCGGHASRRKDGDVSPNQTNGPSPPAVMGRTWPSYSSSNKKCVCGHVVMNYSQNINIR